MLIENHPETINTLTRMVLNWGNLNWTNTILRISYAEKTTRNLDLKGKQCLHCAKTTLAWAANSGDGKYQFLELNAAKISLF